MKFLKTELVLEMILWVWREGAQGSGGVRRGEVAPWPPLSPRGVVKTQVQEVATFWARVGRSERRVSPSENP